MREVLSSRLKRGATEAVLETALVTEATRSALRGRLAWRRSEKHCFTESAFAILKAVCDRLIPQEADRHVDLAGRLEAALMEGRGDGWRFDDLPPDLEAIKRGLQGFDETANAMFSRAFASLTPAGQDQVLARVQDGSAPGETWRTLPPKRLFADLLGQIAALYYAHPHAQEAIGYIGMADAEGFRAIGLNRRDAVEDMASDAAV